MIVYWSLMIFLHFSIFFFFCHKLALLLQEKKLLKGQLGMVLLFLFFHLKGRGTSLEVIETRHVTTHEGDIWIIGTISLTTIDPTNQSSCPKDGGLSRTWSLFSAHPQRLYVYIPCTSYHH